MVVSLTVCESASERCSTNYKVIAQVTRMLMNIQRYFKCVSSIQYLNSTFCICSTCGICVEIKDELSHIAKLSKHTLGKMY